VNKFKKYKYFLICFALAFFMLCQFYSIYFRTFNRSGPLGIDDCFFYISRIAYFMEFDLLDSAETMKKPFIKNVYNNFNGLTFYYIYGKLASLIKIDATTMFHLNFYIGISLLALLLWGFFSTSTAPYFTISAGFILFAMFNGAGSYHGTFWIVPSFYAMCLWLLCVFVLFKSKMWEWVIPILIPLLFFCHMTGVFLIFTLGISLLMHGVLHPGNFRKWLYKTLYLYGWTIISVIMYNLYKQYVNIYLFKEMGVQGLLAYIFRKFLRYKLFIDDGPILLTLSLICLSLVSLTNRRHKSKFLLMGVLALAFFFQLFTLSFTLCYNVFWILAAASLILLVNYLFRRTYNVRIHRCLLVFIQKYNKLMIGITVTAISLISLLFIVCSADISKIRLFRPAWTPFLYYFGIFAPITIAALWWCVKSQKKQLPCECLYPSLFCLYISFDSFCQSGIQTFLIP